MDSPALDTPVTAPAAGFLRSRRYVLFWFSSLLSNMGTWMQQVAQPWIVLSMSHSPLWVGLDSFAMNAPAWIFTLWGGVLADRRDKRRIILICQGIQLLCVLAMVGLLITGGLQVWMIVLISFFVGLTDSLSMPSFQSIIPSLVTPKDIPRAVSFNSAQFNLSRVLGPVIAGIMLARFGAVACFGANAFSYIPFFLSLYWIYPRGVVPSVVQPPAPAAAVSSNISSHGTTISQLAEFREILRSGEVRTPLLTVLVTSLFCSPLITFCPVLIQDVFHSGAGSFGGAMAAFGVGGLIGAGLSLVSLPPRLPRDRFSLAVAMSMGLILVLIAINRSEWLLLLLLTLAGAALTVSNVSANSSLQQTANARTRGRMASLYQLAMHGGISIGALVTGFTVRQLGVSHAFILDGVIAVVLQAVLWRSRSCRPRRTRIS